ncbi:MAG: HAD family hydrolase [Candidatus Omnitrophica bacterium]|nr:HAD family hydrolase [Candidatus Omnitrophota bacterium]
MSTIKLVIFDLDGTIVNAYKAVCESLNYALKTLGYPPADDETIQRSVGWGERNLMSRFVKPEDVDKIIAIYRQHHKRSLKSGTKFMPGAKDLLKILKERGLLLAVATNRPQWSTQVILHHLKIQDYFQYVVSGDMVKRQKPDGEILAQILQKFSLKPDEAVFVGDMTVDVETGHNALVKTVAVATGSSTQDELILSKPFKIVSYVLDVAKIVDELNVSAVGC